MWLTVGDDVRHLLPGDTFALDTGVSHAERYGEDGATYWVARRTARSGMSHPSGTGLATTRAEPAPRSESSRLK
jgi:hypothetical protein